MVASGAGLLPMRLDGQALRAVGTDGATGLLLRNGRNTADSAKHVLDLILGFTRAANIASATDSAVFCLSASSSARRLRTSLIRASTALILARRRLRLLLAPNLCDTLRRLDAWIARWLPSFADRRGAAAHRLRVACRW